MSAIKKTAPCPGDAELPLYNARVLADIVINEAEQDRGMNPGTRTRIVTLVNLMDEQMHAAEIALGVDDTEVSS